MLGTDPEAIVMGQKRTIGQLAKQVGVGVETIRFYERRGLIQQPRKSDGPRHYDDRTLNMLRYLRLAQQLGFSLKEIQALQGKLKEGQTFCASLRAMVEDKLKSLAREAESIARLQNELNAFLARCRARDPKLPCPIVQELTHLDDAVAATALKPRR
jgi:MerR family transcriptional regulator, mercuric resistance operon regulatory protein